MKEPWEHADAVTLGMKVLDRLVPAWEDRIDLDQLNLRHSRLCVLGQVFGRWIDGVYVLQAADPAATTTESDYWADHGFRTRDGKGTGSLGRAWKEAIVARRIEPQP